MARSQVMHHGYALTLAELRENYRSLAETFARHGIATTTAHLKDSPPEGDPLPEGVKPANR
jgi:hypothetical protein